MCPGNILAPSGRRDSGDSSGNLCHNPAAAPSSQQGTGHCSAPWPALPETQFSWIQALNERMALEICVLNIYPSCACPLPKHGTSVLTTFSSSCLQVGNNLHNLIFFKFLISCFPSFGQGREGSGAWSCVGVSGLLFYTTHHWRGWNCGILTSEEKGGWLVVRKEKMHAEDLGDNFCSCFKSCAAPAQVSENAFCV